MEKASDGSFPAFFVWKRGREYKAGRFTYVSNAVPVSSAWH
jgi:hypothetical protein